MWTISIRNVLDVEISRTENLSRDDAQELVRPAQYLPDDYAVTIHDEIRYVEIRKLR